ncbi:MAG: hypothetical protein AAB767_00925 [Patescibacteria group bacterium]
MATRIFQGTIQEMLCAPSKQGKRQLEPFSSEMKARVVPLAIVEDTDVSDSKAEVHTKAADLWYCLAGEATFTVGGTLTQKEARKRPDGSVDTTEWRGTGITGGEDILVKKGNWLYIPAGEAHVHRATGTARFIIVKVPVS